MSSNSVPKKEIRTNATCPKHKGMPLYLSYIRDEGWCCKCKTWHKIEELHS